jgi:hypothetical protein
MEAVNISETSANVNVATWCYIPEDSKLHTGLRENHISGSVCCAPLTVGLIIIKGVLTIVTYTHTYLNITHQDETSKTSQFLQAYL